MDNELPRRVAARDGLAWVIGAFKLFFKSPLILSAGAAIFLGAVLIIQLIPVLGTGLSEIITPLLAAGFMRAYRAVDEGEDPELPHLLAGFKTHAVPLAMVGAAYLGILIAIMYMMKSLGVDYEAMMQSLQKGATCSAGAGESERLSSLSSLQSAVSADYHGRYSRRGILIDASRDR